ncbi:MAG: hypothetical protein AB7P31_12150 [Steroidobacteraceae bacterium]
MTDSIGGPLDYRVLEAATSNLALDRTSLDALADARHHSRAALAALKAMNLSGVPAEHCTELSRVAATLANVIGKLTALESSARLVP